METISKCDARNFAIYDGDAYMDDDFFNETLRQVAEWTLDCVYGPDFPEHLDYEATLEAEIANTDHWTVWEEINRLLEIDLDEAVFQVEESVGSSERVLFIGSIGQWDGTFDGGGTADTFGAAVHELWGSCGSQSDVHSIAVVDGDVHVTICHHDGRDEWTMRALTSEGADALDEWGFGCGPLAGMSERDAHRTLFTSEAFTHSIAPDW